MKKTVLISSVILTFIIVLYAYYYSDKQKYVLQNDINEQIVNSNAITMMYEIESDSGEYQVSNDNTWPQDGYIFNETLSRCENGSKLTWDDENKKVIMQANTSDKCYVYFDLYKYLSDPVLIEGGSSYEDKFDYDSSSETVTFLNLSQFCYDNKYYEENDYNNRLNFDLCYNERLINIDSNFCKEYPNYCNTYDLNKLPMQVDGAIYLDVGYQTPIPDFSEYKVAKISLEIQANNILIIDNTSGLIVNYYMIQFGAYGYYSTNWFYGELWTICISKNTEIIIYDTKKKKLKKKKIQNLKYKDKVLVWNFDNGCFEFSDILWLMKPCMCNYYWQAEFSDGSILKVSEHRIFNADLGKFTYISSNETPVGTKTINSSGELVTLVKKEKIYKQEEFYNVVSKFHMNVFANDILTSCRLNNIYPIKNKKFIKDNRTIKPLNNFIDIDKKWYNGLRLGEQPDKLDYGKGNIDTYYFYVKSMEDREINVDNNKNK